MKKILGILILGTFTVHAKPLLDPQRHALEQLCAYNIWNASKPLRLHLGCGQTYFKGYVNIDFPPADHTLQTQTPADAYADITSLLFDPQTVTEVRSHHVFEHFNRQTALALLSAWHVWLMCDGALVIETPDFAASGKMLLRSDITYGQKQGILRHIFGSHEAFWANHYDGWYQEKFERVLSALGFIITKVEHTQWRLTCNIIVRAKKDKQLSIEEVRQRAHMLLRDSMIDTSESEEKLWQLWCQDYDKTLVRLGVWS